MKTRNKLLIGLVGLILVAVLAVYATTVKAGLDARKITIAPIDLSQVADGDYEGSFEVNPVKVKSKVRVSNHRLVKIDILRHDNGLGQKAETILNDILDRQSLEVDVIAGATVSSKCILGSVADALTH